MPDTFLSVICDRRTMLSLGGVGAIALVARSAKAQDATGTPSQADARATATRSAELSELHTLQTQVASGDCGTPTPTAAPTETATIVPAVPAGTPTALGTEFMVTVLAIAPAVPPQDAQIAGSLLQVNLSVENISGSPAKLPALTFTLSGQTGITDPLDSDLNNALVGADLFLAIGAYATEPRTLMFDYPDPAETLFVLANTSDPSFRVSAEIVTRG